MIQNCYTSALQGIEAVEINVQLHLGSGLPAFIIVGLADKVVAESKERVRAALHSISMPLPSKRLTVNLSPADLQKEGSHYDLAIACGLLATMGALPSENIAQYHIWGELGLDGSIVPVNGVLPAAISASANQKGFICPAASGSEAAWAGDIDILSPSTLLELVNHFKGSQLLSTPKPASTSHSAIETVPSLDSIYGQETAKRALTIAAAGGHNMLMQGPPGAGKSMLASCLPGLLPPLADDELMETCMVHSISGTLDKRTLQRQRPYRAPHHSTSMAAMAGGGRQAKPGEITLSHNGVLFLDELPEFSRNVLETLRQPLETHNITIARANAHVTYPARFQLIAAMNPCRCGWLDDAARACHKAPHCARDYQDRISGPLLDRFDLHIDVPMVSLKSLTRSTTPTVREHVLKQAITQAREWQTERFRTLPPTIRTNSDATLEHILTFCRISPADQAFLENAVERFGISMRGYTRILRVARTIADMEGSETVTRQQLAEAMAFRQYKHSPGQMVKSRNTVWPAI